MFLSADHSHRRSFGAIQEEIKSQLCRILNCSWDDAVEAMTAGKNVDLREDLDFMVKIETHLCDLIRATDGLGSIGSLQFPVNARIVQSEIPEGYLERPFATDYVHCDVWSGAPADSTNLFLYVFTLGDCSSLEIFESLEHDSYARDFRGRYEDYNGDLSGLTRVDAPLSEGYFFAWDTFSPHQTLRGRSGLRISLDIRCRPGTPYLIDGKRAELESFAGYTPGVPGAGIYWSFAQTSLSSFEEKCEYELSCAAEVGPWAVALREAYIKRVKQTGVFA